MNNQGFTLIELVISITILVVISAFAVPGVINYQNFQNEEQFINQTVNNLRNQQLKSISTDSFSNFSISASGISFCDGETSQNCEVFREEYNDIFPSDLNNLNTRYYIDRYGNTLKNTSNLIDTNEITLNSTNFKITITKYGGVYKTKRN
jgi:prepilin-type N-terminal cleavage/methylation domain-containing protein